MKAKILGASAAALAMFVGLMTAPAGAHVEFEPESAPRGSLAVLDLVVPNESETASTVTLVLEFPTKPAVLAAAVQPLPGWQTTIEKRTVNNGAQDVDAVSRITWTGGQLGPGQFQKFSIRAGMPDKGKKLIFKAIQTYSDGEISRWIEVPPRGAPEPEYPAPVITLTAATAHD